MAATTKKNKTFTRQDDEAIMSWFTENTVEHRNGRNAFTNWVDFSKQMNRHTFSFGRPDSFDEIKQRARELNRLRKKGKLPWAGPMKHYYYGGWASDTESTGTSSSIAGKKRSRSSKSPVPSIAGGSSSSPSGSLKKRSKSDGVVESASAVNGPLFASPTYKEIHQVGDKVYAGWLRDKNPTSEVQWFPATIKGSKIVPNPSNKSKYGPVRFYSVKFDDGDVDDNLPEAYAISKSDYNLSQDHGDESKWKGVKRVTAQRDKDEYARKKGWFEVSFENRSGVCASQLVAFRTYDDAVVRAKGGSTKKSDLNLPDEWILRRSYVPQRKKDGGVYGPITHVSEEEMMNDVQQQDDERLDGEADNTEMTSRAKVAELDRALERRRRKADKAIKKMEKLSDRHMDEMRTYEERTSERWGAYLEKEREEAVRFEVARNERWEEFCNRENKFRADHSKRCDSFLSQIKEERRNI